MYFLISSYLSPIDRRYSQLELDLESFSIPLDVSSTNDHHFFQIIVEVLVGFALGVIASVLLYTNRLKDISNTAQYQNK